MRPDHGCVAHPCTKPRAEGSGFCPEHKAKTGKKIAK